MVFRAITSLALVWFLVPHEPNVGLGRPSVLSQAQFIAHLHDTLLAGVEKARTDLVASRQQEAIVSSPALPDGARGRRVMQVFSRMVGKLRSGL